jgi:hypothetical protein
MILRHTYCAVFIRYAGQRRSTELKPIGNPLEVNNPNQRRFDVKKRVKLSSETQKNHKLGIKKTTLQDLDDPKLNKLAGGCSLQPTTTVQPTHQISCIICAENR